MFENHSLLILTDEGLYGLMIVSQYLILLVDVTNCKEIFRSELTVL
jgi:hypothetical protein